MRARLCEHLSCRTPANTPPPPVGAVLSRSACGIDVGWSLGGVCVCVQLWDLRTTTEVRQYVGHTFDAVACAFVPQGYLPPGAPPLVVSASKDCSLRVWHRDTGECLIQHTDAALGDAFTVTARPRSRRAGDSGYLPYLGPLVYQHMYSLSHTHVLTHSPIRFPRSHSLVFLWLR